MITIPPLSLAAMMAALSGVHTYLAASVLLIPVRETVAAWASFLWRRRNRAGQVGCLGLSWRRGREPGPLGAHGLPRLAATRGRLSLA